ncbi:MAG: MobC family plasmid mobilization relaxosome protein [Mesorhizobium sp.]
MTDDTPVFRRGGRPRKPDLDKRGLIVAARVSPDERAAIEERAAASNRPMSDFVREQALTGKVLVRAFNTLSAIDRHDLARIGSNLNQIARACNRSGDSTRAQHIEGLLDELRALLARLSPAGGSDHELGKR